MLPTSLKYRLPIFLLVLTGYLAGAVAAPPAELFWQEIPELIELPPDPGGNDWHFLSGHSASHLSAIPAIAVEGRFVCELRHFQGRLQVLLHQLQDHINTIRSFWLRFLTYLHTPVPPAFEVFLK